MSDPLTQISNGVLFAIFAFATAIFTGATIAWAKNGRQKRQAKIVGLGVTILCLVVWMLMGVKAEELALMFLPFSLTCGALASCLLPMKKRLAEDRINEKKQMVLDV